MAKFTNMRFEPAGLTDDPDIRIASSVMDYIFRRLALDHLPYETRAELGILSAAERAAEVAGQDPAGLGDDPDPEELAQSAAVEQPLHAERAVLSPRPQLPPPRPKRASRFPPPPAQLHRADRGPAGPHRRRSALPDLRYQDAPGRQLLRLRRLRLHQRLQLGIPSQGRFPAQEGRG